MYQIDNIEERTNNVMLKQLTPITLEHLFQFKSKEIVIDKASVICVHLFLGDINNNMLAKIYKLFYNEFNLVLEDYGCRYKYSFGISSDLVAIFDTPLCEDIDKLLELVGKINSIIIYLGKMLQQRYNIEFNANIAVDYTTVLMLQHEEDRKMQDKTWHGLSIATAINLAHKEISEKNVIISQRIYNNIKDDYKKFFEPNDNYYKASIVNTNMNNYVKEKYKNH